MRRYKNRKKRERKDERKEVTKETSKVRQKVGERKRKENQRNIIEKTKESIQLGGCLSKRGRQSSCSWPIPRHTP